MAIERSASVAPSVSEPGSQHAQRDHSDGVIAQCRSAFEFLVQSRFSATTAAGSTAAGGGSYSGVRDSGSGDVNSGLWPAERRRVQSLSPWETEGGSTHSQSDGNRDDPGGQRAGGGARWPFMHSKSGAATPGAATDTNPKTPP